MHVASIKITNWAAFRGEHVLELGPGSFAVVGPNGVGKSAVLCAVPYALFGTLPRNVTAEQMVSEGETEMSVELHLSSGDVVRRGWETKGRKGGGFVEMTGVEGATASGVARRVEEILGMGAVLMLGSFVPVLGGILLACGTAGSVLLFRELTSDGRT